MIRLALIRHGHTAWNRAGRIQGRSDIALDDAARTDLGQLRLPPPWDAMHLVSSPLRRAQETAELISGRAPALAEALTEMNWGQWEGQRGADLLADASSGYCHIEHWGWTFRPPGGESVAELAARVAPWLANLRQHTVAVCHIGIMRVILAQAHGWNFDGPAPFQIKRNRLYPLRVDNGTVDADGPPIRLVSRSAS